MPTKAELELQFEELQRELEQLKQQNAEMKEQNNALQKEVAAKNSENTGGADKHVVSPSASNTGDFGKKTVESQHSNTDQIHRLGLKFPPFWPDKPDLWFRQIEAQFKLAHITQEETKFNHVLAQLEWRFANEVDDIIANPPTENPYTQLKNELIRRLSASQAQRFRQLVGEEELNGRTPSQFLRHLRSLAGPTPVQDDILCTLWMQRLPAQVQAILQTQSTEQTLDKLAQTADRIIEVIPTTPAPAVHATTTAPSTAREDPHMTQAFEAVMRKLEALEMDVRSLKQRSSSRGRPMSRDRSRSRDRTFSRDRSFSRDQRESSDVPQGTGHCWYHATYGQKAYRCKSPCSYSTNSDGSR